MVASRHLVFRSSSIWIQYDSYGCDTAWAETRGCSYTFTCREVEFLVRELAELREMLVGMKTTVTG